MSPEMSTVSLVTGGNRGIGREVCRQLAELGHVVLLTARSADAAATAARATGAEPLPLDVTDPASIAAAARQVGELAAHLAADPAIASGHQRYGAHIVDCLHNM